MDTIRCAEKVEMINHRRKRWELGNLTEDRVGDDDLAGHRGYFCELTITSHRKIVLSTQNHFSSQNLLLRLLFRCQQHHNSA